MGQILTYTPSDVVLTISDYIIPDIVQVSVEWSTEKFKFVRGIRGKNTRVRSLDTSCTIRLSVLQTSIANDVFSAIVNQDGAESSGSLALANLQVTLKDTSGKTSFTSNECYFQNLPSFGFSDQLQNREWVIQCLSTDDVIVGSNKQPLQDIFG